MKKYLPTLFISILILFFILSPVKEILAQEWVNDPEVTFVGKAAARSDGFLNWVLREYQWVSVPQGETNSLVSVWVTIRNIVYAFIVLFVLITALVMIVTRGRSITFRRFLPRIALIILLVTFSFPIIQFLYQIIDIIQGFFLRFGNDIIQSKNLLFVGFDYKNFVGYRLTGAINEESAFISLLLVKLTAVTYYVMVGLLLLRKIILWFFIIVSPIFPLLLLYYPVRNTAKIWIGEFFRWLLYAPLFAIFLNGLVSLWARSTPANTGIPLGFNFTGSGAAAGTDIIYPTAINILLGGPGQILSLTNSVNLRDTFILYVVALLMLWVVILLPWLLLQIFLDYLHTISFGEGSPIKQIINSMPFLNKYGLAGTPPPPPPPPSYKPAGMAMPLPFAQKATVSVPLAQTIHRQETAEILRLANLSIPTMRDIAQYETSTITAGYRRPEAVSRMHETLQQIANPAQASPLEKERFTMLRGKLLSAKEKGNPVATSILTAASTVSTAPGAIPAGVVPSRHIIAEVPKSLPSTNRVQSVNLDDYESVRKMWEENYEKLDVPPSPDGTPKEREEWVKSDMDKIANVINLLSSQDPAKVSQATQMVGGILPFLLIGGFSQTEIIAYLKAKLEAAKTVVAHLEKKKEQEETLLEVNKKEEEKPKVMEASEQAPMDMKASNDSSEENKV